VIGSFADLAYRLLGLRSRPFRTSADQLLRGSCQLSRKAHLHQSGKSSVRSPPDWNSCLKSSSTFFRQRNCSASKILFDNANFNQTLPLQPAQIPGEGGLIQPRPNCQGTERIIRRNRDLRHKTELRRTQTRPCQAPIQKLRNPAPSKSGIYSRTRLHDRASISRKGFPGLANFCLFIGLHNIHRPCLADSSG